MLLKLTWSPDLSSNFQVRLALSSPTWAILEYTLNPQKKSTTYNQWTSAPSTTARKSLPPIVGLHCSTKVGFNRWPQSSGAIQRTFWMLALLIDGWGMHIVSALTEMHQSVTSETRTKVCGSHRSDWLVTTGDGHGTWCTWLILSNPGRQADRE